MADYSLIVRGARVIDPAQAIDGVQDIAVKNGTIAGIGDFANAEADQVIDATGMVASPGWIDLHVHAYDGAVMSGGVHADREAGVAKGVTTVIDAGSSGAGTWRAFREYVAERSTTRVLAFMNISLMPARGPRHGDWQNFSQGKTIKLAEEEAATGLCQGDRHAAVIGNLPEGHGMAIGRTSARDGRSSWPKRKRQRDSASASRCSPARTTAVTSGSPQ